MYFLECTEISTLFEVYFLLNSVFNFLSSTTCVLTMLGVRRQPCDRIKWCLEGSSGCRHVVFYQNDAFFLRSPHNSFPLNHPNQKILFQIETISRSFINDVHNFFGGAWNKLIQIKKFCMQIL